MIVHHSLFKSSRHSHSYKGSAITETAVGAFVLMPVFLILVDLIALVIGQTINDDIAKNAARYAAQGADSASAQALASDYIANNRFAAPGGTGLVTGAQIAPGGFNWNSSQVEVITQVSINLPIPVPFLHIGQQVMQAQATEPSIGVPAIPAGVNANAS